MIKVKEDSEKAGLKLNIQKIKITVFSPIPSWQIDRKRMEAVREFIFLGSKIIAYGVADTKLKDSCSLEE